MPLEIIVLRDSGIPLFHYGAAGSKRLDELVAAFLSLVGHVIEKFSEEGIKEIKFQESKFVWNKKGDLYFIAFVSAHDNSQVYDVILNQLAERFVSKYYGKLLEKNGDSSSYEAFAETIEGILHRFDGVPGMARRYKTCLLPLTEMTMIRKSLQGIEEIEGVERAGYLTQDGFVIASNLRTYELEASLDLVSSDSVSLAEGEQGEIIKHPSLDQSNSLLFHRTPNGMTAVLIVDDKEELNHLYGILKEENKRVSDIDLEVGTRIQPETERQPLEFEEQKMLSPLVPLSKPEQLEQPLMEEIPQNMKESVLEVLQLAQDGYTVAEIREKSGLGRKKLDEILARIVSRGLARLSEPYPNLTLDDSRFKAYLDVVGMPKRKQKVLDIVWHQLDGQHSISEIADSTKESPSRIVSVLRTLGNVIEWKTRRDA
ncbi:MAG: hypothetical protein KGY80_08155 [Candidatus Thorarchaeota archaeon]|nr:hypothetical protein [Candidatus Thorarchaeota archaeon]